jgi:hypothetical protein
MTYTDPRIPTLVLADDGSPLPDDTVDVSQQISNNFGILASLAGMIHVANFGAMPVSNNYTGKLVQLDDTGAIYQYNGGWVFIQDTKWQPFASIFKASSGNQTVTLGTGGYTTTYYWRNGRSCKFRGRTYTGTTGFSGGTSAWYWTLPFNGDPAFINTPENGWGNVYCQGSNYIGTPNIDYASPDRLLMRAVGNQGLAADTFYNIQNADGTATQGTGIPRFTGSFTVTAALAGYFDFNIEYQTAPGTY